MKPSVFVGSSVEQLATARALRGCLQYDANVTIWDEGVFNLGNSTLDDLLKALDDYDFAVFVFSPDDLTRMRKSDSPTVRDNVVFELGLFMGRIGKHRTFWITPRGLGAPHIPTDLRGINTATFEPFSGTASNTDIRPIMGPTCDRIREVINQLGRRNDRLIYEIENPRILCAASPQYAELGFTGDVAAIQACFPTVTVSHDIDATRLRQSLVAGNWDIVHLVTYVDPLTGDLVLNHISFEAGGVSPGAGSDYGSATNRISTEGLVRLVEDANVQLVVLNTCDSLVLAARLARVTNVVAGFGWVEAGTAVDWAQMFYTLLARRRTLSSSFDISQKATNVGLVLVTKKDFRLVMNVPD
jgi:Predicted nucleotide-binding protein containing TIR-like domain